MGYLLEEMETHLYYDKITKKWKAWTNMPNFAERFRKNGWTQTKASRVNGTECDWAFEIDDPKAITIRDMTKPKRSFNGKLTRD